MPRARVVKCLFCERKNCPFSAKYENHLLIHTKYVKIEDRNATAISYAWGQFNRNERCIGHFEEGEPAIMQLGDEWELYQLQVSLKNLCSRQDGAAPVEEDAIWIDQLCIKQDDEHEIRDTLAHIPDIFRGFNVVALFPGQKCECWQSRVSMVQELQQPRTTPLRRYEIELGLDVECLNSVPLYGWASRVWTRQEIVYARCIRFVWADPVQLRCLNQDHHIHNDTGSVSEKRVSEIVRAILGLPKLWYQKCREKYAFEDSPDTKALQEMSHLNAIASEELINTLYAWWINHFTQNGSSPDARILEWMLLGGLTLDEKAEFEKDKSDSTQRDDSALAKFCAQLCSLSYANRFASKHYDYVLSVWVDCPGYTIPSNYKSLSTGQLLNDALKQFHQRFNVYLSHNVPTQLFGEDVKVAGHISEQYFLHLSASSLADIYGPFPLHGPTFSVVDNKDGVANRYLRESEASLGLVYRELSAAIGSSRQAQLGFIQNCVKSFSFFYAVRFEKVNSLHNSSSTPLRTLATLLHGLRRWRRELSTNPMTSQPYVEGTVTLEDFERQIGPAFDTAVSDTNIQDLAFDVTCSALGLDAHVARKVGLHLMVRPAPPMLGISRHDFGCGSNKETFTEQYVSAHILDTSSPGLAYELEQEDKKSTDPSCKMVGVWVPTEQGIAANLTRYAAYGRQSASPHDRPRVFA